MKFFLVFILSLLSSVGAMAAFDEVLTLKKVSEDGRQFLFVRRPGNAPWSGITIKDPQSKVILYEAKVVKCSATACVGIVVHNQSGIKLRADEHYIHSYNEIPIKVDGKELPTSRPPLDKAIYLSYGSPIGPGFKLGYLKMASSVWMGLSYSNISSVANNVNIKGHLLSGIGSYTVFKPSSSTEINFLGELGIAKTTLDFTEVDPDGPTADEATYFYAIAGEGKFNFDRLSLAVKSGMTKAGFSESYSGEINEFNNPYASILVFLELGAYYRF